MVDEGTATLARGESTRVQGGTMDALTAGRWQMEVSLAFHMMFAAAGMAMPAMLLIAESRWLRSNEIGRAHV